MPLSNAIDNLRGRLTSYLEPEKINKVIEAFHFAENAHHGQTRLNGDPYVTHPLAVANILVDFHMDHYTLISAMLHDVIEDCGVSKQQISRKFGATVADLVDGVSKLNKMEFNGTSSEEHQAENFQKMTMAMSKDLRVILVKLADRLHNMRTLGIMPLEKKRRIARETLEIYTPIAQRLGINNLRIEFEELGFKNLYPLRYQRLEAALKSARGNRRDLVSEIQDILETRLQTENIDAAVYGREKHMYSIYRKMKYRKVSFKEMMDVFAFRVVVENADECYRTLGIIHSIYKPIMASFKDYIALPKVNGYQSLHTIVMGSHSDKVVPVEIQIRTREMDIIADRGIAAHWHYKKGHNQPVSIPVRASEWVTDLLEMQRHSGNAMEFIEHVKSDLFPNEVYVFTPTGEIIELPTRATPIDFAYSVHTDIGNSCVGCRLNGRLASLSEPLESGQVVEISTDKRGKPNPAWLNFVVTAKARSAIRHFLKHRRSEDSIKLGRQLLDRILIDAGTSLNKVDSKATKRLLKEVNHSSLDEVLELIGLGNTPAFVVANILLGDDKLSKLSLSTYMPLAIGSETNQAISYASCCRPIPGDPIFSHFTAGRGMVIHRHNCKNISHDRNKPEVCMPVSWAQEPKGEFHVQILVEVQMSRGVIGSLANRTAESDAGVDNISLIERGDNIGVVRLLLLVKSRVHLANVMRRIRILTFVNAVKRTKG